VTTKTGAQQGRTTTTKTVVAAGGKMAGSTMQTVTLFTDRTTFEQQ